MEDERQPMLQRVGTGIKKRVEEEAAMYVDKNAGNESDGDSE